MGKFLTIAVILALILEQEVFSLAVLLAVGAYAGGKLIEAAEAEREANERNI